MNNFILGFKFALSYFTILPVKFKEDDDLSKKEILSFMLFSLPLLGLILGFITLVLYHFLADLSWFGATICAVSYIILYGFIHTEAIIDVVDAIYAKHSGKDAYEVIPDHKERERFMEIFTHVKDCDGEFNTWDFQWLYSVMRYKGVAAQSNVNLISNIGFSSDPTHKINAPQIANLPLQGLPEETLKHPESIKPDIEADVYAFRFFKLPVLTKIKRFISNLIFPKPDL